MLKFLLSNRLIVLYIIPFIIGSVSVLSFEPFNLTIINFIVFFPKDLFKSMEDGTKPW